MDEEPPRALHAHIEVDRNSPALDRAWLTTMRTRIHAIVLMLLLVPVSGLAQNREHLQINADLRMLQEQVSRLQLTTNQLGENLTATNKRLDAVANDNVKGFADQQLLINQVATTLSTVREKLDDNTVRVSQLTQELSAIREGIRMLTDQLNALVGLLQPPVDPGSATTAKPGAAGSAAGGTPQGNPPLAPIRMATSPGLMYTAALNDYYAGLYDNAIDGFREVIEKFPDAPDAANAQFQIAESLYQKKNCKEAIAEYQTVTTQYKASEHLRDAYFMQGICHQDLNQSANAQRMFELVIKLYPDSPQALQARQKLQALGVIKR